MQKSKIQKVIFSILIISFSITGCGKLPFSKSMQKPELDILRKIISYLKSSKNNRLNRLNNEKDELEYISRRIDAQISQIILNIY